MAWKHWNVQYVPPIGLRREPHTHLPGRPLHCRLSYSLLLLMAEVVAESAVGAGAAVAAPRATTWQCTPEAPHPGGYRLILPLLSRCRSEPCHQASKKSRCCLGYHRTMAFGPITMSFIHWLVLWMHLASLEPFRGGGTPSLIRLARAILPFPVGSPPSISKVVLSLIVLSPPCPPPFSLVLSIPSSPFLSLPLISPLLRLPHS
ncbi:hypothetical protein BCV69DRAFT_78555 [Microstroma glucosiphilum]|uniref:Uncharacterized protein n=1 Tax=Pseudomicrostroma glucosiphilum TaxID=1684307 RepID=A0A316TY11_9BASI|nr:hypothetical protein BCV69DRAFT_78555 [Pseudomicrostroma glucosiphilum]PWN18206.1 hypothetical protein BCV69DRAFT_78555 [Pseudomicrostroma glucosiphilum]